MVSIAVGTVASVVGNSVAAVGTAGIGGPEARPVTLRPEICVGIDAMIMDVGTGPEEIGAAVNVRFEDGIAEISEAGREVRVAVAAEAEDSGVYVKTRDADPAPVGAWIWPSLICDMGYIVVSVTANAGEM